MSNMDVNPTPFSKGGKGGKVGGILSESLTKCSKILQLNLKLLSTDLLTNKQSQNAWKKRTPGVIKKKKNKKRPQYSTYTYKVLKQVHKDLGTYSCDNTLKFCDDTGKSEIVENWNNLNFEIVRLNRYVQEVHAYHR